MHEAEKFTTEFPEATWRFSADKGLPEHLDEMLERTQDRVNLQMRERREKSLSYLATISNIAPFLSGSMACPSAIASVACLRSSR